MPHGVKSLGQPTVKISWSWLAPFC